MLLLHASLRALQGPAHLLLVSLDVTSGSMARYTGLKAPSRLNHSWACFWGDSKHRGAAWSYDSYTGDQLTSGGVYTFPAQL